MNPYRTPRLSYLIPAAIIGLAFSFDTDTPYQTDHSEATDTTSRMVNLGVHTAATYPHTTDTTDTTDPYHGLTDTERMAGVVLDPTP